MARIGALFRRVVATRPGRKSSLLP